MSNIQIYLTKSLLAGLTIKGLQSTYIYIYIKCKKIKVKSQLQNGFEIIILQLVRRKDDYIVYYIKCIIQQYKYMGCLYIFATDVVACDTDIIPTTIIII